MNSRRVSALLLAGIAAMVIAFGAAPALAAGRQGTGPAPVTDYATYPVGLGIIPDGCTAQGSDLLQGVQFSMNGGPAASSLGALGPVPNDATVTMTWTGYAPGCEGIAVSLSRKIARTTAFDPAVNQYLNVWTYCGPEGTACAGSLTLDLAQTDGVACYQLDANVGPPLRVVGPDGSFYSLNGRFNTLISANNGGAGDCTPPPCAVPGSPPDMPAQAEACIETAPSSTSAPGSTTTSTSIAPVSTSSPALASSTTQAPISTLGNQATTTTVKSAVLPATGRSDADLARVGVAMIAAGLLLSAAAYRWRTA